MKYGELFTGIGGMSLGLERAGMTPAWFAESDEFCSRVLAKHWPHVPNLGDVTTIEWEQVERVDLIAGGFPCQDVSVSSRTREGIGGAKSGLWRHMRDGVRVLRPRFVLVENVYGLLAAGLDQVLGDLSAIGYDAEWDCLPAAAFGAPHIRDRVYLVAYPGGERHREPDDTVFAGWTSSQLHGGWLPEPDVARVVAGLSDGVDRVERVRTLGNSVVPQVAEWVGRRILEAAA